MKLIKWPTSNAIALKIAKILNPKVREFHRHEGHYQFKFSVRNLTIIETVYVIFSRICVVCAVFKDLGTFILTLKLFSLDKGLPIKKILNNSSLQYQFIFQS